MSTVVKVAISLAPYLLQATDEVVQEENKPRRQFIREALTLCLKKRERQAMIKGHQEMAELSSQLAEWSMAAINEM